MHRRVIFAEYGECGDPDQGVLRTRWDPASPRPRSGNDGSAHPHHGHRFYLLVPPSGLYCTNCAVQRSPPDQIPTAMATLRHLEPDPGSMGVHPVSKGSSKENLPPLRLVPGLHYDIVPVFQGHCAKVHTLFTWEHPGHR